MVHLYFQTKFYKMVRFLAILHLVISLDTFLEETGYESALRVSCMELFYSAKSGLGLIQRSFLKAGTLL